MGQPSCEIPDLEAGLHLIIPSLFGLNPAKDKLTKFFQSCRSREITRQLSGSALDLSILRLLDGRSTKARLKPLSLFSDRVSPEAKLSNKFGAN